VKKQPQFWPGTGSLHPVSRLAKVEGTAPAGVGPNISLLRHCRGRGMPKLTPLFSRKARTTYVLFNFLVNGLQHAINLAFSITPRPTFLGQFFFSSLKDAFVYAMRARDANKGKAIIEFRSLGGFYGQRYGADGRLDCCPQAET
jgi:hypothetical protein